MAKITFGFRNINGQAFDIKVLQAPSGRWPSERTVLGLRRYIVNKMNEAGRRAEAIAKQPNWSPFLTGALVRSIQWLDAREGLGASRVLVGALSVGVPYGRRQEFENKSKSRYLGRALDVAFPTFLSSLRDKNVMEDIIFGRRSQVGAGRF